MMIGYGYDGSKVELKPLEASVTERVEKKSLWEMTTKQAVNDELVPIVFGVCKNRLPCSAPVR